MNDIIEVEEHRGALVSQQVTPMQVIQQAVANGASIEVLTAMFELHERNERNEARKAFAVAMQGFKSAGITVKKNKAVSYSSTKYNHATLDNVCDTIGEELSRHGLSFRWKVDQDGPKIKITCILTHILGHSEQTSFEATADTSGAKNAIQAIGSAITYGQRYTLLSITGTATGEDNDAKDVFDATMMNHHVEALKDCTTKGELLSAWITASSAAAGDKKSYRTLEAIKDSKIVDFAKDAESAQKTKPSNHTNDKTKTAPAVRSQGMDDFDKGLG